MTWYLNHALTQFRAAVNAWKPQRGKASDGTIGDAAHQATTSDHNPDADGSVDAWDMDVSLDGADKPPPAADVEHLKAVFQAHEAARYWIHNRQIASRSTGWRREPYTGTNAHTQHVHWNTRESHEDSTAPWIIVRVEDEDMTEEQARQLHNLDRLNSALLGGQTEVSSLLLQNGDVVALPLPLAAQARDAARDAAAALAIVAELRNRPTPAISDEQLERALRKVLGSIDGAVPPEAS